MEGKLVLWGVTFYRDKICVYDEHPIAGQDIQCRAPFSRSRYARYTDPLHRIQIHAIPKPRIDCSIRSQNNSEDKLINQYTTPFDDIIK